VIVANDSRSSRLLRWSNIEGWDILYM
jgi:hypothetical protein